MLRSRDTSKSMKSVEETTMVIPPTESVQERTLDNGDKVFTRVQRTVVVNQRKEVVQSCQLQGTSAYQSEEDDVVGEPIHIQVRGTEIRAVTPELVEHIEGFQVPSAVSPENAELIHMPTQQTEGGMVEDEEGLTVRVRQVTRHVTRRIIRKRRRIIRKVVIIDGVEKVTEEVVEEPDEVDEQTSEISSGPVFDYVSTSPRQGRRAEGSRSPYLVISEVDTTAGGAQGSRPGSSVGQTGDGAVQGAQGGLDIPSKTKQKKLRGAEEEASSSSKTAELVMGTPPEDVDALLKVVKIEEVKKHKKEKRLKKKDRKAAEDTVSEDIGLPPRPRSQPIEIQRSSASPFSVKSIDSPIDSSREQTPGLSSSYTSSEGQSPDEVSSKLEITVISASDYKKDLEETRRATSRMEDVSEDTAADISWVDDSTSIPSTILPVDQPSEGMVIQGMTTFAEEPIQISEVVEEPKVLRRFTGDIGPGLDDEVQVVHERLVVSHEEIKPDSTKLTESVQITEEMPVSNTEPEVPVHVVVPSDKVEAEKEIFTVEVPASVSIPHAEESQVVEKTSPKSPEIKSLEEIPISDKVEGEKLPELVAEDARARKDTKAEVPSVEKTDDRERTIDEESKPVTQQTEITTEEKTVPSDIIQEKEVEPAPEVNQMIALNALHDQIEANIDKPNGYQPKGADDLGTLHERMQSLVQQRPQGHMYTLSEWIELISIITELFDILRYFTYRIDHSPQDMAGRKRQHENLQKQVKSLNAMLDVLENVEGDDGQPLRSPVTEKVREVLNTVRDQSAIVEQFLKESEPVAMDVEEQEDAQIIEPAKETEIATVEHAEPVTGGQEEEVAETKPKVQTEAVDEVVSDEGKMPSSSIPSAEEGEVKVEQIQEAVPSTEKDTLKEVPYVEKPDSAIEPDSSAVKDAEPATEIVHEKIIQEEELRPAPELTQIIILNALHDRIEANVDRPKASPTSQPEADSLDTLQANIQSLVQRTRDGRTHAITEWVDIMTSITDLLDSNRFLTHRIDTSPDSADEKKRQLSIVREQVELLNKSLDDLENASDDEGQPLQSPVAEKVKDVLDAARAQAAVVQQFLVPEKEEPAEKTDVGEIQPTGVVVTEEHIPDVSDVSSKRPEEQVAAAIVDAVVREVEEMSATPSVEPEVKVDEESIETAPTQNESVESEPLSVSPERFTTFERTSSPIPDVTIIPATPETESPAHQQDQVCAEEVGVVEDQKIDETPPEQEEFVSIVAPDKDAKLPLVGQTEDERAVDISLVKETEPTTEQINVTPAKEAEPSSSEIIHEQATEPTPEELQMSALNTLQDQIEEYVDKPKGSQAKALQPDSVEALEEKVQSLVQGRPPGYTYTLTEWIEIVTMITELIDSIRYLSHRVDQSPQSAEEKNAQQENLKKQVNSLNTILDSLESVEGDDGQPLQSPVKNKIPEILHSIRAQASIVDHYVVPVSQAEEKKPDASTESFATSQVTPSAIDEVPSKPGTPPEVTQEIITEPVRPSTPVQAYSEDEAQKIICELPEPMTEVGTTIEEFAPDQTIQEQVPEPTSEMIQVNALNALQDEIEMNLDKPKSSQIQTPQQDSVEALEDKVQSLVQRRPPGYTYTLTEWMEIVTMITELLDSIRYVSHRVDQSPESVEEKNVQQENLKKQVNSLNTILDSLQNVEEDDGQPLQSPVKDKLPEILHSIRAQASIVDQFVVPVSQAEEKESIPAAETLDTSQVAPSTFEEITPTSEAIAEVTEEAINVAPDNTDAVQPVRPSTPVQTYVADEAQNVVCELPETLSTEEEVVITGTLATSVPDSIDATATAEVVAPSTPVHTYTEDETQRIVCELPEPMTEEFAPGQIIQEQIPEPTPEMIQLNALNELQDAIEMNLDKPKSSKIQTPQQDSVETLEEKVQSLVQKRHPGYTYTFTEWLEIVTLITELLDSIRYSSHLIDQSPQSAEEKNADQEKLKNQAKSLNTILESIDKVENDDGQPLLSPVKEKVQEVLDATRAHASIVDQFIVPEKEVAIISSTPDIDTASHPPSQHFAEQVVALEENKTVEHIIPADEETENIAPEDEVAFVAAQEVSQKDDQFEIPQDAGAAPPPKQVSIQEISISSIPEAVVSTVESATSPPPAVDIHVSTQERGVSPPPSVTTTERSSSPPPAVSTMESATSPPPSETVTMEDVGTSPVTSLTADVHVTAKPESTEVATSTIPVDTHTEAMPETKTEELVSAAPIETEKIIDNDVPEKVLPVETTDAQIITDVVQVSETSMLPPSEPLEMEHVQDILVQKLAEDAEPEDEDNAKKGKKKKKGKDKKKDGKEVTPPPAEKDEKSEMSRQEEEVPVTPEKEVEVTETEKVVPVEEQDAVVKSQVQIESKPEIPVLPEPELFEGPEEPKLPSDHEPEVPQAPEQPDLSVEPEPSKTPTTPEEAQINVLNRLQDRIEENLDRPKDSKSQPRTVGSVNELEEKIQNLAQWRPPGYTYTITEWVEIVTMITDILDSIRSRAHCIDQSPLSADEKNAQHEKQKKQVKSLKVMIDSLENVEGDDGQPLNSPVKNKIQEVLSATKAQASIVDQFIVPFVSVESTDVVVAEPTQEMGKAGMAEQHEDKPEETTATQESTQLAEETIRTKEAEEKPSVLPKPSDDTELVSEEMQVTPEVEPEKLVASPDIVEGEPAPSATGLDVSVKPEVEHVQVDILVPSDNVETQKEIFTVEVPASVTIPPTDDSQPVEKTSPKSPEIKSLEEISFSESVQVEKQEEPVELPDLVAVKDDDAHSILRQSSVEKDEKVAIPAVEKPEEESAINLKEIDPTVPEEIVQEKDVPPAPEVVQMVVLNALQDRVESNIDRPKGSQPSEPEAAGSLDSLQARVQAIVQRTTQGQTLAITEWVEIMTLITELLDSIRYLSHQTDSSYRNADEKNRENLILQDQVNLLKKSLESLENANDDDGQPLPTPVAEKIKEVLSAVRDQSAILQQFIVPEKAEPVGVTETNVEMPTEEPVPVASEIDGKSPEEQEAATIVDSVVREVETMPSDILEVVSTQKEETVPVSVKAEVSQEKWAEFERTTSPIPDVAIIPATPETESPAHQPDQVFAEEVGEIEDKKIVEAEISPDDGQEPIPEQEDFVSVVAPAEDKVAEIPHIKTEEDRVTDVTPAKEAESSSSEIIHEQATEPTPEELQMSALNFLNDKIEENLDRPKSSQAQTPQQDSVDVLEEKVQSLVQEKPPGYTYTITEWMEFVTLITELIDSIRVLSHRVDQSPQTADEKNAQQDNLKRQLNSLNAMLDSLENVQSDDGQPLQSPVKEKIPELLNSIRAQSAIVDQFIVPEEVSQVEEKEAIPSVETLDTSQVAPSTVEKVTTTPEMPPEVTTTPEAIAKVIEEIVTAPDNTDAVQPDRPSTPVQSYAENEAQRIVCELPEPEKEVETTTEEIEPEKVVLQEVTESSLEVDALQDRIEDNQQKETPAPPPDQVYTEEVGKVEDQQIAETVIPAEKEIISTVEEFVTAVVPEEASQANEIVPTSETLDSSHIAPTDTEEASSKPETVIKDNQDDKDGLREEIAAEGQPDDDESAKKGKKKKKKGKSKKEEDAQAPTTEIAPEKIIQGEEPAPEQIQIKVLNDLQDRIESNVDRPRASPTSQPESLDTLQANVQSLVQRTRDGRTHAITEWVDIVSSITDLLDSNRSLTHRIDTSPDSADEKKRQLTIVREQVELLNKSLEDLENASDDEGLPLQSPVAEKVKDVLVAARAQAAVVKQFLVPEKEEPVQKTDAGETQVTGEEVVTEEHIPDVSDVSSKRPEEQVAAAIVDAVVREVEEMDTTRPVEVEVKVDEESVETASTQKESVEAEVLPVSPEKVAFERTSSPIPDVTIIPATPETESPAHQPDQVFAEEGGAVEDPKTDESVVPACDFKEHPSEQEEFVSIVAEVPLVGQTEDESAVGNSLAKEAEPTTEQIVTETIIQEQVPDPTPQMIQVNALNNLQDRIEEFVDKPKGSQPKAPQPDSVEALEEKVQSLVQRPPGYTYTLTEWMEIVTMITELLDSIRFLSHRVDQSPQTAEEKNTQQENLKKQVNSLNTILDSLESVEGDHGQPLQSAVKDKLPDVLHSLRAQASIVDQFVVPVSQAEEKEPKPAAETLDPSQGAPSTVQEITPTPEAIAEVTDEFINVAPDNTDAVQPIRPSTPVQTYVADEAQNVVCDLPEPFTREEGITETVVTKMEESEREHESLIEEIEIATPEESIKDDTSSETISDKEPKLSHVAQARISWQETEREQESIIEEIEFARSEDESTEPISFSVDVDIQTTPVPSEKVTTQDSATSPPLEETVATQDSATSPPPKEITTQESSTSPVPEKIISTIESATSPPPAEDKVSTEEKGVSPPPPVTTAESGSSPPPAVATTESGSSPPPKLPTAESGSSPPPKVPTAESGSSPPPAVLTTESATSPLPSETVTMEDVGTSPATSTTPDSKDIHVTAKPESMETSTSTIPLDTKDVHSEAMPETADVSTTIQPDVDSQKDIHVQAGPETVEASTHPEEVEVRETQVTATPEMFTAATSPPPAVETKEDGTSTTPRKISLAEEETTQTEKIVEEVVPEKALPVETTDAESATDVVQVSETATSPPPATEFKEMEVSVKPESEDMATSTEPTIMGQAETTPSATSVQTVYIQDIPTQLTQESVPIAEHEAPVQVVSVPVETEVRLAEPPVKEVLVQKVAADGEPEDDDSAKKGRKKKKGKDKKKVEKEVQPIPAEKDKEITPEKSEKVVPVEEEEVVVKSEVQIESKPEIPAVPETELTKVPEALKLPAGQEPDVAQPTEQPGKKTKQDKKRKGKQSSQEKSPEKKVEAELPVEVQPTPEELQLSALNALQDRIEENLDRPHGSKALMQISQPEANPLESMDALEEIMHSLLQRRPQSFTYTLSEWLELVTIITEMLDTIRYWTYRTNHSTENPDEKKAKYENLQKQLQSLNEMIDSMEHVEGDDGQPIQSSVNNKIQELLNATRTQSGIVDEYLEKSIPSDLEDSTESQETQEISYEPPAEPEYFVTEPEANIQEQEVTLSVQPIPEEIQMDTLTTLQSQIERSLNQPKGSQPLMLISQPEAGDSLDSLEDRIQSLAQRRPQGYTYTITEWIELVTIITEVLETVRYWTHRIDHSPQGADEKRPQYENLQRQVKSLNAILESMEKVESDDGQPLQSPLKEKIRDVLNVTRAQSALVQQFLADSQEALKEVLPDSAETKWDSESLSRQESSQSSSDQAPETPPVQAVVTSPLKKESGKKKKSSSKRKGKETSPPDTADVASPTPARFNIKIGEGEPVIEQQPEPVRVSVEPPTPESQIQYVVKISSPTMAPVEMVDSTRQTRSSSPPERQLQRRDSRQDEGISITLGPTESVLLTSDDALDEGTSGEDNITVVPVTHPVPEEGPAEGKTHKVKKEKKKVTFEKKQAEQAKPVPVIEIPGPSPQELQLLDKVVDFKKELQKLLSAKPSTLLSGKGVENAPEEQQKLTEKVKGLQERVPPSEGVGSTEEVVYVEEILEIIERLTILIQTLKRQANDVKEDISRPISEKLEKHNDLQDKLRNVDDTMDEVKNSLDKFKMNPEVKDHLYDILSGAGSWSHQAQENLRANTESLRKSQEEYQDLQKVVEGDKRNLNGFVDKLLQITDQPKITPSDKLVQVDAVEPDFHKIKQDVEDNAEKVYKWIGESSSDSSPLAQQVSGVNVQLMNTEALLNEEKDRLVQIIGLADEYEQTLHEFSQVIEVAEALVEEKLAVKNLNHLQDELQKNRSFFGNLKRCQQALEKLEYDLDASTREMHKDLHQRLYNQATSILERAAKRRQQMAVASARWSRLEHGLNEEMNWLAQTSRKIPSLKGVASTDCERYCGTFQTLYSDVIVHQARLMQLRTVCESLLSTVACPELEGRTDSLVEDLLNISNRITSGLQCLVGFRDAFLNYERLIHRLKSWLQKAEAKMDAIALQPQSHPYDFWELKAQLESQQPLKNESSSLLDSALRVLSVTDEPVIRDNYSNFEDRWLALSSVITQTEKASYIQSEADSPTTALAVRLNAMDKDVNEIKDTLQSMVISVETEDDLYSYLEKLQILKAQILNKKHQLNTIKKDTELEPKDAERIGALLAGLSDIDVQVTDELETAHVIREKFATFGRMSLKTRRLQDTLRARVDQWASFFELSQDILKQALQNCQSLDEDITNNHVDLEKMHGVLSSFPSSSHLSLNTNKMEHELHEMEATVHTLTARVQDLRKRVQEQLGVWQDYEHCLNTISQLLHHSQSTLDLVDNEPPTSLHALQISERYLNNVEEALRDKAAILQHLQTHADKLKAESPEDVQKQIDESVEKLRSDWKTVEERLSRVQSAYRRAQDSWSLVLRLKSDISEWLRPIYPHVVELESSSKSGGESEAASSELVTRLQNELPTYESKMSELDQAAKELCMNLFYHNQKNGGVGGGIVEEQMITGSTGEPILEIGENISSSENGSGGPILQVQAITNGKQQQLPITIELEALNRKLLFLRSFLSVVADSQQGGGGNKPDELLEQTKATFSSISAGIQSDEEPSVDRLTLIYEHLLSLGNAEGRMKAAQSSSPVPDSHLTELLHNSRRIFQQTFVEYLRVWKSLSERESIHEIFSIWENYLLQCQNYLKEPIPITREQLIEDESLCKVYQTILNGQHSTLSEHNGASGPTSRDSVVDVPALEKLYWEIETQLVSRQKEIEMRLGHWKNFLKSQDSFSSWLRNMEREKRALELPFLQLKRLESTTKKIELLLEKCVRGKELLDELKQAKDALLPFASPELKASLLQDVSSNNARFQNIEAALRTWLDHTNRLADMHDNFQQKTGKIGQLLTDITERLQEEKVPSTFSHLKKYLTKLERLQKEADDITPLLDEVRSCLEDMKSSISPADARLLSQKLWWLSQQHVELLSALQQSRSEAEEKVDLIPVFDTKCKNWVLWAKGMQEKLNRTMQYQTLDDYSEWLAKECAPEISSKESAYTWITTNGKSLAEMTSGTEKKDLLGTVKQVKQLWSGLNDTVKQRIGKVTHLQDMLKQLNARIEESLQKLKSLEKFVIAPVTFQELSGEEIGQVLQAHEGERKKLNAESCDVNQTLNLGELAATDCDDLKMYQDAFRVRQQCESLDDSWKHLLARFNKKTEALSQLRDKAQTIDDGCEFVESLLSQVNSDLGKLEKQAKAKNITTSTPSADAINGILGESQNLLESLKALSPKVEDIGNEYCFIAKQVSARNPSGKLSQRVKKVINDWRSYLERGGALVELCQRRLLLCDFNKKVEGTEGCIQDLLSKTKATIKEVPSLDYETGVAKLSDLTKELKRVEDLRGETEETGNSLLGKDRSSEGHIDSKMTSIHKLKRSLEEKLLQLEESLKKMKAAAEEAAAEMEKAVQVETLTKAAIDTLSAAAATAPVVEVNKAVQVETLFGTGDPEGTSADESSSRSSDVVTTTQSEMGGDQAITLTRVDIYLQELLKALADSRESMELVESLVEKEDVPTEGAEADSYDSLVRALANTQSMVDHVKHLHQLLVSEHKVQPTVAKVEEVEELLTRLQSVEEKARAYGQKLREASPASKQVTCPVCTPSQRGAWDSTLWRLEQWLNHADAKLKQTMKKRPPTSLEQLEEAILTHRELVLDLDSHRSLVSALTGVLNHLGKHGETRTMGQVELDKLRDRLRKALDQWKKVCHRAAAWQARLQIALIENPDFHLTITQYEEALNTVQETIHRLEPVDLGQSRKVIVSKLRKFTDLKDGLLRMEPELATLLQTAEQLFTNATAIEKEGTFRPTLGSSEQGDIFITPECSVVLDRISDLNHRLKSLQKVCDAYVKHLTLFLQQRGDEEETGEDTQGTAAAAVLSLSDQIIEQSGRSSSALAQRSASPQPSNASNEREDGHAIVRGGRYLMRVVRASIPIQAMILLLLGAASLIPYGEQDFLCSARNTLQSSLEPMLHYPDGPPPI